MEQYWPLLSITWLISANAAERVGITPATQAVLLGVGGGKQNVRLNWQCVLSFDCSVPLFGNGKLLAKTKDYEHLRKDQTER